MTVECELDHGIAANYDTVRMMIKTNECKMFELRLDKKLDVTDKVMNKIEEYHKALRLITEAINDEFIEVEYLN